MHQWRLLCHLPALPNLYISDCSDLTSSRESIWALSSLQSLSVHRGYQAQLPKWLGHLTALQKLSISWCKNLNNLQEIMACRTSLKELCISNCKVIESLPESIQQLTKLEILEISECPALEQWCESEENKMKLAHIKEMVRDLPCLVLTTIFSYNVYSDKIFRSAFLTCMIAPCRYSCVHLFLHCNSCFFILKWCLLYYRK